MAVDTFSSEVPVTEHLVRVTKGDRWLISCAAGAAAGKGTTKRVKALSRLKAALDVAVAAEDAGEAVTVEDTVAHKDPMNALDAVDTDGPSPQKKK